MTYEIYEAELRKRLESTPWNLSPQAAGSPASELMKHIARDAEISLDEYGKLENLYRGYKR